MFKKLLLSVFCVGVLLSSAAYADEAVNDPTLAKRQVLAEKLGQAWGVQDQVMAMVEGIVDALPANRRSEIHGYMMQVIDLDAMEKIAVEAAVEVFTEEELKGMVAYYSSDIAQSAEKKRKQFNAIIQPKIQAALTEGMRAAVGTPGSPF